jgi:hypothetical protein
MGAHIVQGPIRCIAQITFHPVIAVQDAQGSWRDACNLQVLLPVPPLTEFSIFHFGIHIGIFTAPIDPFTYLIQWRHSYRFTICGLPWEDFTHQISLARTAIIGPLKSHNLQRG